MQLLQLEESLSAAKLELRRAASEYRRMVKFALPLIVLMALLSPGNIWAQTPPQKVVVTDSNRSIASIDLFVAQERGFFREEALDPHAGNLPAIAWGVYD
jgi:hypothetical protein